VVGGPGVVHGGSLHLIDVAGIQISHNAPLLHFLAMAGVFHAQTNAWPLLVLAGSSESFQQDMGAFQELDQVSFLKPHVKFVNSPVSSMMLVFFTESRRSVPQVCRQTANIASAALHNREGSEDSILWQAGSDIC
jgi:thiamine pyrophosphate-dependent acetolactate synthase large subunit-like protein